MDPHTPNHLVTDNPEPTNLVYELATVGNSIKTVAHIRKVVVVKTSYQVAAGFFPACARRWIRVSSMMRLA